MKSLKRVLIGALSLVLMVGACFALTGCKLSGKTYAYGENATITLITKTETDSEGKITVTETKDLTLEEYFLYDFKDVALDKLAESKIEETDKEAFDAWKKTTLAIVGSRFENVTIAFKSSKIEIVSKQVNEATGETVRYEMEYEYDKVDDHYVMTMVEEEGNMRQVSESTFTVDANDNVCLKVYNPMLEENSDLEVGKVFAYNVIFTEVKD